MTSRIALPALVVASMFFLNGCEPVASFFPLYKSEDKVFETGLLGTWKLAEPDPNNADEKNERWVFEKSGDAISYDFKLGAAGESGGMLAKVRLVRLGSNLFADFEGDTENKALESKCGMMPYPVIPVHMMGRVWLEKDSLRIHFLKDDWVKDRVKAGSFPLSHLEESGDFVLTAKRDELRKFMQEHADDEAALSENHKLVREK